MTSKNVLLDTIKKENYCLMTDECGKELLDKEGNLIVCKPESGDLIYIPNTKAVRELYDLNIDLSTSCRKELVGDLILTHVSGSEAVSGFQFLNTLPSNDLDERNDPLKGILSLPDTVSTKQNDDSNIGCAGNSNSLTQVWTKVNGQSVNCMKALKALIDLVSSPKYRERLDGSCKDKLSVWEEVAAELQNQGFYIAHDRKEAARRTYQKWRNFNKYRINCSRDNVKRKNPKFYNEWLKTISADDISKLCKNDAFHQQNSKSTTEIPSETTIALLRIMASDKYEKIWLIKGQWKKIFEELTSQGCNIPGLNAEEKIRKLCQKWRNLKKLALKHHHNKTRRKSTPRPIHYNLIMHIITKELKEKGENCDTDANTEFVGNNSGLQDQKQLDHDYVGLSEEPTNPPQVGKSSHSTNEESSPPLLVAQDENSVVVDYVDSNDEHFILPEIVSIESFMESSGSKTKDVFQPDNLKSDDRSENVCETNTKENETQLQHIPDENAGKSIISKENISQPVGSNSDNSTENNGNDEKTGDVGECDDINNEDSMDSDSCDSESATEILRQIKSLQETAMVKQQENFAKVISLMEEQVKNQRTLNEMFFHYVTRRSNKAKSHIVVKERLNK